MNKSELIETVSTEADISKAAAERALNSIIETVTKAVTKAVTDVTRRCNGCCTKTTPLVGNIKWGGSHGLCVPVYCQLT